MHDGRISLNTSQRQRLLVSCRHIDKLLSDIEATLDATASKTVFPSYIPDISPIERTAIEDYIARIRTHLLLVLHSQSLVPEPPQISAAHSISVNLTFIDIAIAELAPRYMRGYGPVSEQGAADLNAIAAELESAVQQLARYISKPSTGDLPQKDDKPDRSSIGHFLDNTDREKGT